jgi:hypothetical protein
LTKRLIRRANRLEKVNFQIDHRILILDSFLSAAVPHHVVQSFINDGTSLILDNKGIIRCQINLHRTRCVIGTSLVLGVSGDASDEAEEEGEGRILGNFLRASRSCSSQLSEW